MQSLDANKQLFWYAEFLYESDAVDANGKKTGGKTKVYATPKAFLANVSAARGTADAEQFGINDDYERTIVTDDLDLPISEDTALWIGSDPRVNPKHNYKLVRVARSINSTTYAIKKVSVS